MTARFSLVLAVALALAACSKGPQTATKDSEPAKSAALLLATEDLHTVRNSALTSGPSITGSVQPERRADLRAEVSAIVLKVVKENGDAVRRGDLLVQLDDTAIRDSLASAEAASRNAAQAREQANRQFERMTTLRASGMASAQQLDDAEGRRNAAQSDLEAAKARGVLAQQQMQRTAVRAPFDGVVTDRKVSPGDTAQIGKELVKVIDPGSMRFEALISADHVGEVKVGQAVHFRVNGYGDQEFAGKVRRVNPAANATTRQVEVLVDFVGQTQPKLAGLYAEGRLETQTKSSLTIPATALVRDGDKTSAWRVKDNKLQKVPLAIAERDERSGDYVLASGLAEGDQVIRHPNALLKEGQAVVAAGPAKSSMVATGARR
ncbi:MAG: efflux RND transporter periplasmic adaptor subunit [Pseudomonadota bacterium]|nr:efflux RND transporter periplasmic adaptor subunit [Pseudomonadota bacterium]